MITAVTVVNDRDPRRVLSVRGGNPVGSREVFVGSYLSRESFAGGLGQNIYVVGGGIVNNQLGLVPGIGNDTVVGAGGQDVVIAVASLQTTGAVSYNTGVAGIPPVTIRGTDAVRFDGRFPQASVNCPGVASRPVRALFAHQPLGAMDRLASAPIAHPTSTGMSDALENGMVISQDTSVFSDEGIGGELVLIGLDFADPSGVDRLVVEAGFADAASPPEVIIDTETTLLSMDEPSPYRFAAYTAPARQQLPADRSPLARLGALKTYLFSSKLPRIIYLAKEGFLVLSFSPGELSGKPQDHVAQIVRLLDKAGRPLAFREPAALSRFIVFVTREEALKPVGGIAPLCPQRPCRTRHRTSTRP